MARGIVVEYDTDRGIGEIETTEGLRVSFHCSVLSDGSRLIDEGATVEFTIGAGRLGRWEAVSVAKT